MAAYIDTDKPQPWFVRLAWDDPYHGTLVAITGSLADILRTLHGFANQTGAACEVFHPSAGEVPANADWLWKEIASLPQTMLLRSMAVVTQDDTFSTWKRAMGRAIQELPPEQKEAELNNVLVRVQQELEALKVQKEVNVVKTTDQILESASPNEDSGATRQL